jgi:DNA-binding NarL/FixJ family response regulator
LLLANQPGVTVVGEARHREEALELAARERPDVVVLDWELPDLGGRIAMIELKARLPGLAVVAISTLPEARRAALSAGAEAFFSKGAPPETLLAAIERVGDVGESLSDPNGPAGTSELQC